MKLKTILTISILLSCLCGKGQSKDTSHFIFSDTIQTAIGWSTAKYHFDNKPLQVLQSQITALQARVDSLIEARRRRLGDPFEGLIIGDVQTSGIWSDTTSPAAWSSPPPYSLPADNIVWTTGDNGIPMQEASGTLFSWGRNKGDMDGKGVIEFDKDSVLHPTPAAQRRMNKDLNRWLRYDSVPAFTAYLIDTRSHTIAIDHRTNLPHVRPDHPVEGMLIKYKGRYEYFERRMWVKLKEVK